MTLSTKGFNMSDDEKYMALMGKYKDLRGKGGPEANKYLKAAMALKKTATISQDVILGSAYL